LRPIPRTRRNIDIHYIWQKCSPEILVFGSLNYLQIFEGFFRELFSNGNRFVPVEPHVLTWLSVSVSSSLRLFTGRQIACHSERCTSYSKSVYMSVWLSVTRWHGVKMLQWCGLHWRIGSMTLVSSWLTSLRNSKGNIASDGAEWERGNTKSQFSAKKSSHLRNGEDQGMTD